MSQSAITLAFERWKASATEAQQPVILDEFVLANVPNLDPSKPIDRNEGLPDAKYIMHRQAVNKTGVVNQNAVAYSVTIGAEIGDFDFNWIGLLNKQSGTVAMIVHAPTQRKIKTQAGQQGNVLTRSFLLEYLGASKETAITTPAEMWQIDFTARLTGMDEMQRLINRDKYGVASFFNNGFLVAKAGNQFYVTRGLGYIEGLRAELAENKNITVTNQATKVWVDVSYQGNITSDWDVHISISVKPDFKHYTDNAGFPHFVFAVASISATGVITDLRPKGTLDAQYFDEALKKHEQSRNHPDATTTVKGFTTLDNRVGDSQITALTPYGAKKELENYQLKGDYQPAGDYADKSTSATQVFSGAIRATGEVQSSSNDISLTIKTSTGFPTIVSKHNKDEDWRVLTIPNKSGTIALFGDSYTKKDSDSALDKKFDKSKISQAIGVSPEHVMSQKACVDSFAQNKNFEATSYGECRVWSGDKKVYLFTNNNQNSGLYSVEKKDYIWGFNANGDMLGGRVPVNCGGTGARDVATAQSNLQVYSQKYINDELNKKFDKSKISQGKGVSTEHVMSQKACVDNFQPKGDYADKSTSATQVYSGAIRATGEVQSSSNDISLTIKTSTGYPTIVSKHSSVSEWRVITIPNKSGTLALISDIDEANIYPWGVLIPWCGATAPDWALVANGSAFNKTTYSKLGQYFPSGRLPDARANVLRGLDAGRGIDTGRTILSEQMGNSLLSSNIFGGLGAEGDKNWRRVIDYIGISGTDNDGGYGVYQQKEGVNGQETRMRNTAVLWIVRAK
ncbi:phage tail-collar fiber domain-containing protein [Proteus vulgaris]|uniref:phage tail-collar fiber domain-containing protein n=1 Tax=Proteus vulgaris TaxID=585 RepID=UPI000F4FA2A1|nr:phage tail protein [Proteus vulgaris]AYY81491.1 hypothetical protein EGX81_11660 [Proteus vulgaris]